MLQNSNIFSFFLEYTVISPCTTELTTIYNNLILSMQTWILRNADLNSKKRKLDSFDLNSQKRKLHFFDLNSQKRKLHSFDLNSQKRKLDFSKTQTWFFWCKLEFHKTQTWIYENWRWLSWIPLKTNLISQNQPWRLKWNSLFWILTFCFSYFSSCFAFSFKHFGFGFRVFDRDRLRV